MKCNMCKIHFQLPEMFWFRGSIFFSKQFSKIEDLDEEEKSKVDYIIKL